MVTSGFNSKGRMADKLGLGSEVRELKLGSSFTNSKKIGFHTLRYDFKPASVDINKMATIDVGSNSEVTVTVPPSTVFKGSSKPYQKQCIVIVNRDTGEFTLEKLSYQLQVKKIRSENRKMNSIAPTIPTLDQFTASQKAKKPGANSNKSNSSPSGNLKSNLKPGGKNKSKLNTNLLSASNFGYSLPKHSPLHASPNRKSPNAVRSSPNRTVTNASLPRIGIDDGFPEQMFPNADPNRDRVNSFNYNARRNSPKPDIRNRNGKPENETRPVIHVEKAKPAFNDGVGVLSDSSSSSSSSSSGDSSDSSDDEDAPKKMNNQNARISPCVTENLLKKDLELSSESGSDSD